MSIDKSLIKNEQMYFASLLSNPDLIVGKQNFHIQQLQKDLFNVLKTLSDSGVSFIQANVVSEGNKVNSEINDNLINGILGVEFNPKDFSHYEKRVKEDNAKFNIQNFIVKELLTTVSAKGELDYSKLNECVDKINTNLEMIKGKEKTLLSLTDLATDYEKVIDERKDEMGFISSGDSYLDSHLVGGGFMLGTINLIFGPSGVGKSIKALNMVAKQINKQIPALYCTLEMGKWPTFDRLLGIRTENKINDFTKITEENEEFVKNVLKEEHRKMYKQKNFYLVEDPSLTIKDLEELIILAKKKMGVDRLVVTIDLLTMLKDFSGSFNKSSTADAYEAAMNKLHIMVRMQNVALVGVVQAKRPSDKVAVKNLEDVEKFRPTIEMLKNSSALEERSRIVLGVHRAKHYMNRSLPNDPQTKIMDDIMSVSILKQNMGGLARMYELYNPLNAKLYRWEEESEDWM